MLNVQEFVYSISQSVTLQKLPAFASMSSLDAANQFFLTQSYYDVLQSQEQEAPIRT
jgi:hypothetical protein